MSTNAIIPSTIIVVDGVQFFDVRDFAGAFGIRKPDGVISDANLFEWIEKENGKLMITRKTNFSGLVELARHAAQSSLSPAAAERKTASVKANGFAGGTVRKPVPQKKMEADRQEKPAVKAAEAAPVQATPVPKSHVPASESYLDEFEDDFEDEEGNGEGDSGALSAQKQDTAPPGSDDFADRLERYLEKPVPGNWEKLSPAEKMAWRRSGIPGEKMMQEVRLSELIAEGLEDADSMDNPETITRVMQFMAERPNWKEKPKKAFTHASQPLTYIRIQEKRRKGRKS